MRIIARVLILCLFLPTHTVHSFSNPFKKSVTKKIDSLEEDFLEIMRDFLNIGDKGLRKFASDHHGIHVPSSKNILNKKDSINQNINTLLGPEEDYKERTLVSRYTKDLQKTKHAEHRYQRRLVKECFRRRLFEPKLLFKKENNNKYDLKDGKLVKGTKYRIVDTGNIGTSGSTGTGGHGYTIKTDALRQVSEEDPAYTAWLDTEMHEFNVSKGLENKAYRLSDDMQDELPPLLLLREKDEKASPKLIRTTALLLAYRQSAKTPLRLKTSARFSRGTTSIKKLLKELAELIEDNSGKFTESEQERVSTLYKDIDNFSDRLEHFYAQVETFLEKVLCIPKKTIENEDKKGTFKKSQRIVGMLLKGKAALSSMKASKKEIKLKGKKTSRRELEAQQRAKFVSQGSSLTQTSGTPVTALIPEKHFLGIKIKKITAYWHSRQKAQADALKTIQGLKTKLFAQSTFDQNKDSAYPIYNHLLTQFAQNEAETMATGLETFVWRMRFLDAFEAIGKIFIDLNKKLKKDSYTKLIENHMNPIEEIIGKINDFKMKGSARDQSQLLKKKDFLTYEALNKLRVTGQHIYNTLKNGKDGDSDNHSNVVSTAGDLFETFETKVIISHLTPIAAHVKRQTYLAWSTEYQILAHAAFGLNSLLQGLKGGEVTDETRTYAEFETTFEKQYFPEYEIATRKKLTGEESNVTQDQSKRVQIFGRERGRKGSDGRYIGPDSDEFRAHSRFTDGHLGRDRAMYRGDGRVAGEIDNNSRSHKDISYSRGRYVSAAHRDTREGQDNPYAKPENFDSRDQSFKDGYDRYGNQGVGGFRNKGTGKGRMNPRNWQGRETRQERWTRKRDEQERQDARRLAHNDVLHENGPQEREDMDAWSQNKRGAYNEASTEWKTRREQTQPIARSLTGRYRVIAGVNKARQEIDEKRDRLRDDELAEWNADKRAGYNREWDLHERNQERRERAATRIQSVARGHQQRQRYNNQRAAATKIQSVARGRQQRKQYTTQRAAATRIQSVVRGRQQRQQFLAERNAAVRLQGNYRGRRARQGRQDAIDEIAQHRQGNEITRRNQAYMNDNNWTQDQRRLYDAEWDRYDREREKAAATRIQAAARGRAAARRYQRGRSAAVALQSVARGRAARKREEDRSARVIQNKWRNHKNRDYDAGARAANQAYDDASEHGLPAKPEGFADWSKNRQKGYQNTSQKRYGPALRAQNAREHARYRPRPMTNDDRFFSSPIPAPRQH